MVFNSFVASKTGGISDSADIKQPMNMYIHPELTPLRMSKSGIRKRLFPLIRVTQHWNQPQVSGFATGGNRDKNKINLFIAIPMLAGDTR